MRIIRQAGLALLAFFALGATANATVHIHIDLSSQRMHVTSSSGSYNWAVSTARSGYTTPRGSYAPTSLQRMHYSRKYHMSPMPHSIFFRGGYAIHGTYSTGALGRPASHGCVRLAPGNAAQLFSMVKAEGARISISGSPPRGGTMVARAQRHSGSYAARRMLQAPMAYAPYGYAPSVQQWQYNPWQR
ncbi:MAG: L,D-transpeptidase [Methylobacteriaceae bacterium]|nr:L,D-transpeptidase [Methylobacteriaceae bacterium]